MRYKTYILDVENDYIKSISGSNDETIAILNAEILDDLEDDEDGTLSPERHIISLVVDSETNRLVYWEDHQRAGYGEPQMKLDFSNPN